MLPLSLAEPIKHSEIRLSVAVARVAISEKVHPRLVGVDLGLCPRCFGGVVLMRFLVHEGQMIVPFDIRPKLNRKWLPALRLHVCPDLKDADVFASVLLRYRMGYRVMPAEAVMAALESMGSDVPIDVEATKPEDKSWNGEGIIEALIAEWEPGGDGSEEVKS